MNKTRRRAIEKHRAKEQKHDLKRKAEATMQAAPAPKSRTSTAATTAATTQASTATAAPRTKSTLRRKADNAQSSEPATDGE